MMQNSSLTKTRMDTRTLVMLAAISALAFVSVLVIRFPFIPAVSWLRYEPKDVFITMASFMFGPMSALLVSIVVSLIEMITISDNGPVGFLMNVLASVSFACPAGFIYKRRKSISGAVAGLTAGVILMTIVMLLWNYIMTPIYFGMPREAVVALMIPGLLPFNLIKGCLNAVILMLIYKPLTTVLRKRNMLPHQTSANTGRKKQVGVYIAFGLALVTLILVIIAFNVG